MADQDLSTDDLKLVRYRILQTQRDDEHIIHQGDRLVNYRTTAQDFGGLVTCEYFAQHPQPPGDRRFIRTSVEVIARYPKQEAEYERETVHVLREIRDRIRI